MTIHTRRAYDHPSPEDGARFLVDRLWPRGIKREALALTGWLKDVSPSHELRHTFHHDPQRWEDFCQSYFAELDQHPASWQPIIEAARSGPVTLVYGARDTEHNNAVALKRYLEHRLGEAGV